MVTKEDVKEMMSIQLTAFKEASSVLFQSSSIRIEEQNKLIYELKQSLEFTQRELQDVKADVTRLKTENVELKRNTDRDTSTIERLQKHVAGLEDYSRRKNIRVEGIQENPKENWQQTQEKVQKMINEKLQLTDIKVEYAHRISSHQEPNTNNPRTIIARLQHDIDRNLALRSSWRLKGTQTYINEDLSELTMQKRKEKIQELKTARHQGKIAYFKKDRLIIKERRPERTSNHSLIESTTTTPSRPQRNTSVSQLVNVFSPQPNSDTVEQSAHAAVEVTGNQSGPTLRPRASTKS